MKVWRQEEMVEVIWSSPLALGWLFCSFSLASLVTSPEGSRASPFLLLQLRPPRLCADQHCLLPHPQSTKEDLRGPRRSFVPGLPGPPVSHLATTFGHSCGAPGDAPWALTGVLPFCGVPSWLGGTDFCCKHGPSGRSPGAMF